MKYLLSDISKGAQHSSLKIGKNVSSLSEGCVWKQTFVYISCKLEKAESKLPLKYKKKKSMHNAVTL